MPANSGAVEETFGAADPVIAAGSHGDEIEDAVKAATGALAPDGSLRDDQGLGLQFFQTLAEVVFLCLEEFDAEPDKQR